MAIEENTKSTSPGCERLVAGESRDGSNGEPTLEGVFSADGVDRTLICWMLDRSPEERLQAAQNMIDTAWVLRGDEA